MFDIGGTSPLRLTFKTDSGEREMTSAEVGRIVLSHTDAAAAAGSNTSATAPTTGSSVVVNSKTRWTPTGITVRRGETLTEIAVRFNVTLRELQKTNPQIDPNSLQAGQVIRIR